MFGVLKVFVTWSVKKFLLSILRAGQLDYELISAEIFWSWLYPFMPEVEIV